MSSCDKSHKSPEAQNIVIFFQPFTENVGQSKVSRNIHMATPLDFQSFYIFIKWELI
jgi:hypothetical protein